MTRGTPPTAAEAAIEKLRQAVRAKEAAKQARIDADDMILDALVDCRDVPISWPILQQELGLAGRNASQAWAGRIADRRRLRESAAAGAPAGKVRSRRG